jgi:hypothetical protein
MSQDTSPPDSDQSPATAAYQSGLGKLALKHARAFANNLPKNKMTIFNPKLASDKIAALEAENAALKSAVKAPPAKAVTAPQAAPAKPQAVAAPRPVAPPPTAAQIAAEVVKLQEAKANEPTGYARAAAAFKAQADAKKSAR